MDLTNNKEERFVPQSFFQTIDANDCGRSICTNCEALKDRLKQLSYCLAVAQRLTNMEAL